MRRALSYLLVFVLMFGAATPAFAVNPDEVLSDPILEERARDLSVEIRCLVCQNQSIDDSDAQLARDLRVLVREKLVEGMSDKQVLDYLVERYGEFVLLKPRFNANTFLLWVLPGIVFLIGLAAAFRMFRSTPAKSATPAPLSAEEQRELDRLINQKD